jgi:hypothetical protein
VGEPLAALPGVHVIRRRLADGCYYFIANQGTNTMDGWYGLAVPAASAAIMDPMTGSSGEAKLRREGVGAAEVRLRLPPGQSIIVRTRDAGTGGGPEFAWPRPGRQAVLLESPWQVSFVEGGPVLPAPWSVAKLVSWTKSGDPAAEAFAGTAVYRTTFATGPIALNVPRLLDLGEVRHVARARLNGRDLGVAFMHPYMLTIPPDLLRPDGNALEIEVTNLAANRIRDLDRRKVAWRIFHDANVVNIQYKPFDASNWPVFESGLLGPVSIRAQVDN